MKTIYITNHLGLGDHIICNGIYRHYAKIYDSCAVPALAHNYQSVKDMLSDLKNIEVVSVDSDEEMIQQMREREEAKCDVLKLGYYGEDFLKGPAIRFDRNFYLQANIDFEKRWSEFDFPRDMHVEHKLFEQIVGTDTKEGEYIFLHEDASRGFEIDRNIINNNLKIVSPVHKQGDRAPVAQDRCRCFHICIGPVQLCS